MAASQLIYTAIDDSGERGTTAINLPTGFSLSQFGEFATAMATLLDAMLGGRVESAEICFGVDISGLTSNTVQSFSDVEEIGAFQFRTLGGFPVGVNVPCIDELMVASGSDDLDQTDADIIAFITAIESGIVTAGGNISPTDVAEDDITTTVSARERFRASGTRR
jgi:hypothetical protein